MKKFIVLLLVLALLTVSFAACTGGKEDKPTKPGETQAPTTVAVEGELFDDANFTIVVPTGWEYMEVDGGIQIYKMSGEVIEVHYRGFNQGATHAKLQVESAAKRDDAEVKEVEFLGKTFWYTAYMLNGKPQVFYALIEDAIRNGEEKSGVMLSLKYANFEDAAVAETILKTIVWK